MRGKAGSDLESLRIRLEIPNVAGPKGRTVQAIYDKSQFDAANGTSGLSHQLFFNPTNRVRVRDLVPTAKPSRQHPPPT